MKEKAKYCIIHLYGILKKTKLEVRSQVSGCLGLRMRLRGIDNCINYLLLYNILLASLRVPKGQKSGHSLHDCFWPKDFHEVIDQQLSCLLTTVLSEGSTRGGSASKLTYVVVDRTQFLVEFSSLLAG